MDIVDTSCCGVKELDGIDAHEKTEDLLSHICYYLFEDHVGCAFLTFTDKARRTYGSRLTVYIRKHNFGQVLVTRAKTNPNSGNVIRHYTWTPNLKNLAKWFKKHPFTDEDDDEQNGY